MLAVLDAADIERGRAGRTLHERAALPHARDRPSDRVLGVVAVDRTPRPSPAPPARAVHSGPNRFPPTRAGPGQLALLAPRLPWVPGVLLRRAARRAAFGEDPRGRGHLGAADHPRGADSDRTGAGRAAVGRGDRGAAPQGPVPGTRDLGEGEPLHPRRTRATHGRADARAAAGAGGRGPPRDGARAGGRQPGDRRVRRPVRRHPAPPVAPSAGPSAPRPDGLLADGSRARPARPRHRGRAARAASWPADRLAGAHRGDAVDARGERCTRPAPSLAAESAHIESRRGARPARVRGVPADGRSSSPTSWCSTTSPATTRTTW
jgi:hypothetical protein